MRTILATLLLCHSVLAADLDLEVRGLRIRLLGSSAGTGNDASESTAAYMPVQGELLVAMAINTKASAPDLPTASGNGLTWYQLWTTNFNTLASPIARLTVFYTRATSGFFRGAFTASTGATSQTGWMVAVAGIEGANIGGSLGTNAFIQIVQNGVNVNTNATATLAALRGTRSLAIGFIGYDLNSDSMIAQNGFTKLVGANYATPPCGGAMIYKLKADTTTVAATNAASIDWAMVAAEIRQLGDK